LRVGTLDVAILVDGEGSFATVAEAFPALSSGEEWRDRVEPLRDAGSVVLVDGELEVASGVRLVRLPATRRATRASSSSPKGKSWSCSAPSWSGLAKEGEAAVE
jgi:hypothetical protein